jgi:spermidine/putrescine transport system substrate-binding protein
MKSACHAIHRIASTLGSCAALFAASCDQGPAPVAGAGGGDQPPPGITILTWDKYLDPDLLAEFERETGVRAAYETVENSMQFAQRMASQPGKIDLVVADDKTMLDLIRLRLVGPLERSQVPHFTNLDQDFLDQYFDPGNRYSVPYFWGTMAIAWRRDLMPEPPRSWRVLWDEGLQGRITLVDEAEDLLLAMMMALGRPPELAQGDSIETAGSLLAAQLADQHAAVQPITRGIESLRAGTTALLVTYNCDAVLLASEHPEVATFIPAEGAPMWLDSFAVASNSARPAEAHRFIDFMLTAGAAARSANNIRAASPNRAALAGVSPELRSNPTLYPPPELMRQCRYVRFEGSARREIDRALVRFYAQLRQQNPEPGPDAAVGRSQEGVARALWPPWTASP